MTVTSGTTPGLRYWRRHSVRKDGSGLSATGDDTLVTNMLRRELLCQVRSRLPVTYRSLAGRAAISSPGLIRDTLEALMEEDADEGRPFLSAIVVSDSATGLPAPWFFRKANELGVFFGSPLDVEAFAFHAREFYRVTHFYAPTTAADKPRVHGWCRTLTGRLG